jgi:hypothetical protein
LEKGRAALMKQIGVAQLVDRMCQVQTPQKRVWCELRCAEDVASAVAFDFGKRDQLAHASIEVAPHPSVQWPQDAIDARAVAVRLRHDRQGGEANALPRRFADFRMFGDMPRG